MPYIGSAIKDQGFSGTVKDTFSGDGSTVEFTLSQSSPTNDVEVLVGNVQQEPIVSYSISGATLTFTEAPPSGTNNIYVLHRGRIKDTILPPADLGDKNYNMSGALDVTGNLTTGGNLKINNGGTIGSTGTTDAMTVSTGGGVTFKNDLQNPRIKVDGTASGTGLFTLQAPDSSTARTLTLPDATGTAFLTEELTGMVAPFAGTSAPSGWLSCDGSAVSRTTYADLFSAISTTWGVGDGSANFNVPDLRGAFVRGSGTQSYTNTYAGGDVGDKTVDTLRGHGHKIRTANAGSNTIADGRPHMMCNNNSSYPDNSQEPCLFGKVNKQNPGGVTEPRIFIDDVKETDDYPAPTVGNETVPFNATLLYCIKI